MEYLNGKDYCEKYVTPSEKLADDRIHNLNIHLAYHCNLNCASCAFYAPLAPAKLPDKDLLVRSLHRLSELTIENNKPLDHIFLMGGEPLLNPDLCEFMNLTRKLFSTSSIYVYTNGLLVLSQPNLFWETLKKNNIILLLTHYFTDETFYEKILNKADEFGCKELVAYSMSSKNRQFSSPLFVHNHLSKDWDQTPEEGWNYCPWKNATISLDQGRLYSCQNTALIRFLNDYFKESFNVGDEESADIFEHTYDEIIEILKKPKHACKYCEPNCCDSLHFLKPSKRNRSEWLKD